MAFNSNNDNRGNRRIAGAWGTVHINGEEIFEVESVDTNIEIQRGEIQIVNNVDSKVTGMAGSGTLVIKHVYTRFYDYLSQLQQGHDPRFVMSLAYNDPDAVGGQKERVNIGNVWFNNLPIFNFTRSEVVEKSFEFGFTPGDVEFAEVIA